MEREILVLEETPILSHQFNDGNMLYLVEDEGERKWVPETAFEQKAIENYWNNVEAIDLQDQRQIEPGELIALIPNSYTQTFSSLIRRETEEDPLMIVPSRKARIAYQDAYLNKMEEIYHNSPVANSQ
jgi:hypothetical protein